MTDQPLGPTDPDSDPFAIAPGVAHPARIQNYLAGGDGNFAADRDAADHMSAVLPAGIDTARAAVRSLGSFMSRAMRHLAVEADIRQFVNVGAAVPTATKAHEIAQHASPGTRFVYVGNDPMVLAHAHALRASTEAGTTAYVHGALSDPQAILDEVAKTLDLSRPVALILLGTLNFVHDNDDPHAVVACLLDAVPSGSCLAIAHASYDIEAVHMAEAAERLSKALHEPFVVRSEAEISRFFDTLELLEPGLVPIDDWRPTESHPHPPAPPAGRPTPIYVGIGRKP